VRVSSPDTDGRFLPPICVEPRRLHAKLLRDARLMMYMMLFATVATAVLFYLAMGVQGALVGLTVVSVVAAHTAFNGQGIIGIPGGIAGLMGCMLVANLRDPQSFPRHFAVVTAFVAASTLFTVSMFLSSASLIAHLGGFLVGAALGCIADPVSHRFHVLDAPVGGPGPCSGNHERRPDPSGQGGVP
jgi:membrane associated rhomboid family serine protease